MTTEGYRAGQGWHPGSMAMAGGLSLAAVLGIAFSAPVIGLIERPKPIVVETLPLPPDPPPIPQPQPKPRPSVQPKTMPIETVDRTPSFIPHPDPGPTFDLRPTEPPVPTSPGTGTATGAGEGGGGVVLPKLPPVITIPTMDPRYLSAFQPPYPPQEERAERPGRVVVRILVGIDGRVKRVDRLEATSDAFFTATERQALRAWRFKPATRDGVPIEAERMMTVTFRFNE